MGKNLLKNLFFSTSQQPAPARKSELGFAAFLGTVIVMAVAIVVISSVSLATITEQKITKNAVRSAQAYYSAESGVEDSLYRIVKGKNYFASNSLEVASSSATISVSGTSGQKTIKVNGEQDNRFRNLQVKLNINTQEISFYYGVQVGEGGLVMSNNSQVQGSIYSNGTIQGSNGANITGDAWVASLPASVNQESAIANSDLIFGQQTPVIDAAQSFVPSATDKLIKVSLYLKKFGNPANKTVRILTDNSGQPSKNLVASGASGTLQSSQISASGYGWVDVPLDTPPTLQSGTKYWIMIDTSADASNYFFWGRDSNDTYANNTGKTSANWNASSPVWSSVSGDLAFKTWMGSIPNSLSGLVIGGHAHANTINNCSISGDAYYQTISGSTVGGTPYPNSPDPAMENMPISEQNIANWKTEAEAGGTISSYSLTNGATGSLGPKKITGNLSLSNNADLTITGTVYVVGNITISNGAKLRLGANYGETSGVLLTDGSVSVSNNCVFYTNGAGTYLMILSTKAGGAINISNNANTVIFYASAGTVDIANNATLKEVTAYQINLSNGAQIIYESGLASAKFSSGSGASWAIADWQEVP
jgi:hypothetical protein